MGATLLSEPSEAMLNLAALAFLLGISIVTWCIARATQHLSIFSRKTWFTMPWMRVCVLMVLVVSWLHLCLTGMILYGAPSRHTPKRCSIAIVVCVVLYTASKALVYFCLIERVYAVWGGGKKRQQSVVYCICIVLLLGISGSTVYTTINAIRYLYNGYCVVGISRVSSILLLIYDVGGNLCMTVMFVIPLARSTIRSSRLKIIATRASIATSIALITTVINAAVLYTMDGEEMIWICFGSCAADVVVNAVVLYWAMGAGSSKASQDQSVQFSDIPRSNVARARAQNTDILGVDAAQKGSAGSQSTESTYPSSSQNGELFSLVITETSSESIATFKKPEPIVQSPRRVAQFPQVRVDRSAALATTDKYTGHGNESSDSVHESNQETKRDHGV